MRFILGLTTGALVTLFVATALNAPTDKLVGRAAHAWAKMRAATADVGRMSTAAVTVEQTSPTPTPTPSAESTESSTPPTRTLPVEAVAVQQPTPRVAPARTVATQDAVKTAPPAEPLSDTVQTASTRQRNEWEPEALPDETTRLQRREVVVWGPFHSEASAQGFAGRLAREIERPFTVRRQGPAKYLVTYVYTQDAERVALDQEIALVIGAPRS